MSIVLSRFLIDILNCIARLLEERIDPTNEPFTRSAEIVERFGVDDLNHILRGKQNENFDYGEYGIYRTLGGQQFAR